VNPGKHKKPRNSPSAKPISWHRGWQEVSPAVTEHAPEAGGQPTETGGQPIETGGQPTEAGGQPTETGQQPTETGGQPTEAGQQPAEPYGDDQPRFGVEHRVALSTEPTVLTGDGNREAQYLSVSLERQADDTAPRVLIGRNGARGMAATVNEARRFALDILGLVNGQHHPEGQDSR